MEIKTQIKIKTTDEESIEWALCLAYQGYEDQAMMILALIGFGLGWHIDILFYYLDEAGLKVGNRKWI